MLEIKSNGSKWYGQEPDTIEDLIQVLNTYPLDPVFEKYGNFVSHNPRWLHKPAAEKYKGCTVISGNFSAVSHVFNIVTDEPETITILEQAINKNKQTDKYKNLRKEYIEREQRKENAQKLFNEGKIGLKEIYTMSMEA